MTSIKKTVFILAGFLLPSLALAQEEAPLGEQPQFSGYSGAAWAHVYETLAQYMPQNAISRLTLIAYHLTAEEICNGVHTDTAKVGQAVLALRPSNFDELSEAKQTHWNEIFLANLGMVIGVMLAEHAEEADSFCNEVHQLMADESNDWHYFDVNWVEGEDESEDDSGDDS